MRDLRSMITIGTSVESRIKPGEVMFGSGTRSAAKAIPPYLSRNWKLKTR
jgi:hypothetical protein